MTALPILYSFRRCPYAMRARMALGVSGVAYEHREVVLANKPAAMLLASPKGTVPVLVLPDGGVIDESLDIMRWALGQNDPEGWLARTDDALIEANDGPFKHDLDRYKYPERHGSEPIAHRSAGLAFLADLDARLERQPYLSGGTHGLIDIAIMPFVRQFAKVDPDWFAPQSLPALHRWLGALLNSPVFMNAMARHAPWVEEPQG